MGQPTNTLYQEAVESLSRWELDKAEDALNRLLADDPAHAPGLNKMGVLWAKRGDLQRAASYFQEALRHDPELASAYSNLGNIYQQNGWTDRAIAAYEKAIKLDPDFPTAHHNLGVLYKKMGRIGESVDLLKKAGGLERSKVRTELKNYPKKNTMTALTWLVLGAVLVYLIFLR